MSEPASVGMSAGTVAVLRVLAAADEAFTVFLTEARLKAALRAATKLVEAAAFA